jgi:transposase
MSSTWARIATRCWKARCGSGSHLTERDTPLGRWTKGLLARAHRNVAVVALANKLARIAWAVLRRREKFTVGELAASA